MTSIPTNSILGTQLKDIVVGQNMPKGGTSIADRIAELSVPTGLVYIPEESHHTLKYRSSNPYYTYETISEELYDKLLDLISENGASKHSRSKSKSKKPKIKGVNSTRRNA